MSRARFITLCLAAAVPLSAAARDHQHAGAPVSDEVIAEQRQRLAENTRGQGFGPQSPRDIDDPAGGNPVIFGTAPPHTQMNLCNIHFHKHAEHRGGEFTRFAGNGDGQGKNTGYRYSGTLTERERAPVDGEICPGQYGALQSGDTIELHYVHSTARVSPGPTLGACLNESIGNPQLRVETQVYVLVNDPDAADFVELTEIGQVNGFHQAINIPDDTGAPVRYAGSTTGPGYNEKGSPFQVTWSVRPKVMKVDIESVGQWCGDNVFDEDHAHGVRNLVINPALISEIAR